MNGTAYELAPELAGETVLLLWGLFDNELYVEYDGERSGPYVPVAGPIPLNRYRAFKKTSVDEKADRIRQLADQLGLPIAALTGDTDFQLSTPITMREDLPRQLFNTESQEYHYPNQVVAKLAIADEIAMPLAKLAPSDRSFIDHVLTETFVRSVVLARIREYFRHKDTQGDQHAS